MRILGTSWGPLELKRICFIFLFLLIDNISATIFKNWLCVEVIFRHIPLFQLPTSEDLLLFCLVQRFTERPQALVNSTGSIKASDLNFQLAGLESGVLTLCEGLFSLRVPLWWSSKNQERLLDARIKQDVIRLMRDSYLFFQSSAKFNWFFFFFFFLSYAEPLQLPPCKDWRNLTFSHSGVACLQTQNKPAL